MSTNKNVKTLCLGCLGCSLVFHTLDNRSLCQIKCAAYSMEGIVYRCTIDNGLHCAQYPFRRNSLSTVYRHCNQFFLLKSHIPNGLHTTGVSWIQSSFACPCDSAIVVRSWEKEEGGGGDRNRCIGGQETGVPVQKLIVIHALIRDSPVQAAYGAC